jgi:6-phosphogluconolactonase (cycloisomerase 2 family)
MNDITAGNGAFYISSFNTNYVYVFSYADPANPTRVAIISNPDLMGSELVLNSQGSILYAKSSTNNKLLVYNVSNPANPVLLQTLSTPSDGSWYFHKGTPIVGNYLITNNATAKNLTTYLIGNDGTLTLSEQVSVPNAAVPAGVTKLSDIHYAVATNTPTQLLVYEMNTATGLSKLLQTLTYSNLAVSNIGYSTQKQSLIVTGSEGVPSVHLFKFDWK